jgi:hypothetical protein
MSAIVTPMMRQHRAEPGFLQGIDPLAIGQLFIDAFRLNFDARYTVEPDTADEFALTAAILLGGAGANSNPSLQAVVGLMLQFLKANTSLPAIRRIVNSASNRDFSNAHRQWRAILRIMTHAAPVLTVGSHTLSLGQNLIAKFPPPLFLLLVALNHAGNKSKIDTSLTIVRDFILCCTSKDFLDIIFESSNDEVKAALRVLLNRLADIWNWHAFPFSSNLPREIPAGPEEDPQCR